MWCGQAPDAAALAACCVFTGAVIAWAIAALGALVLRTGDRTAVAMQDVLVIAFVACTLIAVVHIAPPTAAALLATVIAAHALLIAAMLAADAQAPEASTSTHRSTM